MSGAEETRHPVAFPDLVKNDDTLMEELGGGDLTPEQADEAERLVRQAALSGAVTWDAVERSELRRVISNWVSLLDRVGRDTEIPELASFAGVLPSADRMDARDVVAHAKEGKPIIAARVENADLRELDGLAGLRVVDSVFVGCNFEGIESHQARFLHSNLRECSFRDGTFPGLVATSCVFNGGSMAGAVTQGATFSGTNFENFGIEGCDFWRASFGASILFEVRASDAILRDCLFDLTNIRACDFSRADLADAIFAGANVRESSFQGADLSLAIFSGTDVRGSSFSAANLDRTFFAKAIDISLAEFDRGAADTAKFAEADLQRLRESC